MRLIHIISSLERGGAQAVLYDLVQELAKRGYQQSIIYFHDGPYVQQFKAVNIPIYHIKGAVVPFDMIALMRLYTLLKRLNPDCVHSVLWAANWMARIVCRWLEIPSIASLHNNYDQNGSIRNFLDKFVSFSNNAIIAVSDEVQQSFEQVQRVQCPIVVIRNGINYESLQKMPKISRDHLQFLPDHFIIGSVGRFVPIKRYSLLLEAFAQLHMQFPQARLLLIGAGPQEALLRNQAVRLGIAPFIQWVIDMPAYPYYAVMDCFILTSPKEGISMALLEAMSCGVACLVTSATLSHSVLDNLRNGLVVNTNNATLLSQKLALLITNISLRKRLALQAQQTIKGRFGLAQMIDAYDQLFQRYYHQH
jgi:glycosyltransferase involved in cell wall biosynthesis